MQKIKITGLLLFIFISSSTSILAQFGSSDSIHFSGIIFDSENLSPVANVHVYINGKVLSTSNNEGEFFIWARTFDTLSVSHIAYKKIEWIVPDSIDNPDQLIGFFLSPDSVLLSEVLIYPRLNEIRQLMNMQLPEDQELVNARNNLKIMAYQAGKPQKQQNWGAEQNQDKQMMKYQSKAFNNGFIPQDQMIPVTAIIPMAFALIREKYKQENQKNVSLIPKEQELLKSLYYSELMKRHQNKN